MKTSAKGLALIASFEGEVLHVYNDGFGYPTAGIGHLLTPAENKQYNIGDPITKEQSRKWLSEDIRTKEAAVNKAVKVDINQNQFDALISLTFNIGEAGFNKSSVLKKLNAKDYIGASNAFLLYDKARKNGKLVSVKGLHRRRDAERKLFLENSPHELLKDSAKESATPPPTISPVDDTANNSSSAIATPSLNTWEKLKGYLVNTKDKLDTFTSFNDSLPTSLTSKVVTIGTKGSGWAMLLDGLYSGRWVLLGVGTVLICAGLWYWSRSRDRASIKQVEVKEVQ